MFIIFRARMRHNTLSYISEMTRGWATGSARVARVPIPVVLDHIYINSSHPNQTNVIMIWSGSRSPRMGEVFLSVAPVLVQVSQNIRKFLLASSVHWGCMSSKWATMKMSNQLSRTRSILQTRGKLGTRGTRRHQETPQSLSKS